MDFERPIVIIANTTKYIFHYRRYLIKKLLASGYKVIVIAPIDETSEYIAKDCFYIPWRVNRKKDNNISSLIISFFKLMYLIQAIKPSLIHSHTIKPILLSSIISSIYGIPNVISFAGLGKLSVKKGFNKIIFTKIMKIIIFFAHRTRVGKFKIKVNKNRSHFIFQNKNDLKRFESYISDKKDCKMTLIRGSGVPEIYFQQNINFKNNLSKQKNIQIKDVSLIYCGRLLRSKGIDTFMKISQLISPKDSKIFGGIDSSSEDSLTHEEIKKYQETFSNVLFYGEKLNPLINLNIKFPILITPSNYGEGLSRTICEACALKIPVISSERASSGAFTDDHIYINKSNRISKYIELINKVIEDHNNEKLYARLDNAFEYVSKHLSEKNIVSKTINIYDEINLINKKREI